MKYTEFYSLPTLASFLPLKFETGPQCIQSLIVHCNDCRKAVSGEQTKAEITKLRSGYRSAHTAYDIKAYALCPFCDRMTIAHYVYHFDTTLVRMNKDGSSDILKWDSEKKKVKTSFWTKFVTWFRNLNKIR